MDMLRKIAYIATRNPDLLVEQTDNGVQPDDPIQDVSQDPDIDYGVGE